MLRKEYFDCPQRERESDSHAGTLHLLKGRKGSLYSCTLLSCNRDDLHRPLCEDGDKISEIRTSTYILHLSALIQVAVHGRVVVLSEGTGTLAF